jgi:hypothetical protein
LADVIFGPYFTKNINYHQHDSSHKGRGGSKPNDYKQMQNWYESIQKFDLNAVIFHNEHSKRFIEKYSTDKISFQSWHKKHRPSYNDERIWTYREYLTTHPEIERVFMTDLYDVQFFGNPFELFENHSARIFAGEELLSKYSSRWMVRKCREMKTPLIQNKYAPGCKIYNAGIIGGYREDVLELLERMVKRFLKIPKKFNANMPVFNLCLQEMNTKIFSGYPLHNKFRSQKYEDGIYIKHK